MNLNRAVVKMTHNKSINYARKKCGPDALTCAGYCDVRRIQLRKITLCPQMISIHLGY